MTIKIATKSIIVMRKNKAGELTSVQAPLDEPFDFTDEEIQDITDMGCGDFLRSPVNEVQVTSEKAKKTAPAADL